MNLKDCYIRQGGKIFPWGGVRIFNRLVKDSNNPEDGVAIWFYELIKYGKGDFFAEVSVYGNITIRRKKDQKRVATIKTLRGKKEASALEQDEWAEEFDTANAGKISRLDNSAYVRVSARLHRTKVQVISRDVAFGDTLAVMTMDGHLISFVEHAPFSDRNVAAQGFPDEAFEFLDDDDSSGW